MKVHQKITKKFTVRVELERLVRSVDGDGDGSGGGDGLLQFIFVVLIDVRETDVGGADVLLAESEIGQSRLHRYSRLGCLSCLSSENRLNRLHRYSRLGCLSCLSSENRLNRLFCQSPGSC